MVSVKARRRWRTAFYVAPLTVVIGGGLVWSSFSTFHYAESPVVPGGVAWTLCLVLDGAVVVTTPPWLSTSLPRNTRFYAGIVCALALTGSMLINYAETGWVGVWAPLIAAALIHLVGVVLRAFAEADRAADAVPVPATVDRVPAPPVLAPVPSPAVDIVVDRRQPTTPVSELADRLLAEAWAEGTVLTGAQLTELVRKEGHEVNVNYGRSRRHRWLDKHPDAAEAVS